MQIFLWGLMVLGALAGLVGLWVAIHYAGVALAHFFEELPGRIQEVLSIVGIIVLAAVLVLAMGTFYWMARWHHGVPIAILFSIFFTAVGTLVVFALALLTSFFFGWVEE